jgi:glycine/D-amino acid oxidase-like deaminating enzyme
MAVWWLEQALARDPGIPCPPLAETVRADVCIVGGGYTGLWTAIELREQAPDVSVVLLEAQGCGFGASGRNGGWAHGWDDELDRLVARFGAVEALRLADRGSWTIDRIESFCDQHGIDCCFRRAGALWTATAPAWLGAWDGAVAAGRAHGREGALEQLSGEELQGRTGSPLPLAGVREPDAAAVQPALLARGMRRVALELGVRIFEGTPMRALERGRPAVVRTPAGRVEADRVVLATGAWSGRVRELRRAAIPVGSHIVLTEPLGERIAELEWSGGELLRDARLMVHYVQVTPEGRIAFGRGGGALGRGGRVRGAHFHDPATVASIAADFRRWFPQFADARLTHAWGGPVDRAPGHLPFTGRLGDHGNVLYGFGYSGRGVAPSALIGRMLGRQALGIADADTTAPLADGPPDYLPPEPLRTVGGLVVRALLERVEQAQERGVRVPFTGIVDALVAAHTPRWLEPRLRVRRAMPPERAA